MSTQQSARMSSEGTSELCYENVIDWYKNAENSWNFAQAPSYQLIAHLAKKLHKNCSKIPDLWISLRDQ